MRWNAYKLIAVGLAVFSLYAAGFYFLADSSLNSEALRLPLVFRGFSYSVLSIALMWCLHEIMSFQHFFQALSIFNILHMFFALLMLLWDIPGVRRREKHMQTWPRVGLQVLNGVHRQQKLLRLRRKRSKME